MTDDLFDGLVGIHEEPVYRLVEAVKEVTIHNLIRLIFFPGALGLLLLACQRQPPATQTAVAVAETVATEEERPTEATTAPVPSATLAEATVTPDLSPTALPEATATATPAATAALLPLTEELTVDFVAHEGGNVRSVVVRDTVAYVGVGPRLVALDVSNPASPAPLGRSELLPGLVEAVVLEEEGQQTTAYAAAGDQLVALNLSADGEITVEGTVAMPGYTKALALAEGMLYAGGRVQGEGDEDSGFIAAVAVQQPEALRLVDTANISQVVLAIALAENALYVGHYGGLSAALVDNGQLGSLRSLGGAADVYGLQVVGGALLVGDHMTLHAYDISARTEGGLPRANHLWRIEANPDLFLGLVEGIAVRGNTVYTVGNIPGGAYNPFRLAFPAPEPFDGEAAPSSSPLVALSGNHLFVAEGDVLEIYDVSRPGELIWVGGYGAAFPAAGDLAIEETAPGEGILYLYDGSPHDTAWERLFSYRLPMLDPLGQLTIEAAERDTPLTVRARFGLALGEGAPSAYLSTADGVYQIDIGNPAAPRIAAYQPYAGDALSPLGLVVQGDRVYLGQESSRILVTAFTAGGGELERTGQFDGEAGDLLWVLTDVLWAVAGADNKLYVTTSEFSNPDHQDWLHVIETDGDEMSLLNSLALPGLPGWGTLAAGGSVVATTAEGRLLLIDVSAPEEPALAASVAAPGPSSAVYALAFHEGRLFVVVRDQLLVVDVTNPAHPRAIGAASLPAAPAYPGVHLAVSDNIVAVAIGEMGLFVFEMASRPR